MQSRDGNVHPRTTVITLCFRPTPADRQPLGAGGGDPEGVTQCGIGEQFGVHTWSRVTGDAIGDDTGGIPSDITGDTGDAEMKSRLTKPKGRP